jgi:hypothetical protein
MTAGASGAEPGRRCGIEVAGEAAVRRALDDVCNSEDDTQASFVILSGSRFFAALRMTRREGLGMTEERER